MPGRVLIISPNFPPKSTADLHRVRTSLPYYRAFGWEPTILCVAPEYCEGIDDPLLTETLPQDISVIRVAAWDEKLCRRFGFGLLEYRALWPLYRAGSRLLRESKYDVVFFSTTAFLTFVLGPLWRRKFGCRIVYDFQDPWYQGAAAPYDRVNAPGGWRRYLLGQWIARYAEAFSMRSADGVISVSEGYVEQLRRRYAFLKRDMFAVIPFGAAYRDQEVAQRTQARPPRPPGILRWVSVGRAGGNPGMNAILAAFFEELARLRRQHPELVSSLKVDFVGTNYAPAGRAEKLVLPLAAQFGLDDIVTEEPGRIPYFDALALYADSDAILMFGSSSTDYVASRLFNCVLARKPILAMFREHSLVAKIATVFPNVFLATFSSSPAEAGFSAAMARGMEWLKAAKFDDGDINRALLHWSAEALSEKQCRVFEAACGRRIEHDAPT